MRRVHTLLGQAVPPKLRTEIRRAGGGTIPVELSVSSLRHKGEIVGRVAIVRQTEQAGADDKAGGELQADRSSG